MAAAGSGPVDLDCYAAVNLMTMSARQAAEAAPAAPAAAAASPSVSIGQTHDVEQVWAMQGNAWQMLGRSGCSKLACESHS